MQSSHPSATTVLQVMTHPKTLGAFLLLIISAVLNFITGSWIQGYLPNTVVSPDLLLLHLPYLPIFHTIAEVSLFFSLVLLAYIIYKKQLRSLPFFLINLATVYAVRAVLITLTPLAQTSPLKGQPNIYGATFSGMYPSGHIALSTIIFLLVRKYGGSQALTRVAGMLVCMQGISLLLSHSHYGIDLIGGMMLAYVVYRWMVRFKSSV